jgi:hypothetical protein
MKFKVTDNEYVDLRLAIDTLRSTIDKVSTMCVTDPLLAQKELKNLLSESSSFVNSYECIRDLRIIEDLDFDDIRFLIRQKGKLFEFKFKDSDITFCSDESHLFAYMADGSDFFNSDLIENNILNYDKKDQLFELISELKKCHMRLKISDFEKENTTSGLEFVKESMLKEKIVMGYYSITLTGTESGYVDLEISDTSLDYHSEAADEPDGYLVKTLNIEIPKYFGTEDEYYLFTDGDEEASEDFYVSVRLNKFGNYYIETYFDNDAKNLVDVFNEIDTDNIVNLWKFSINDDVA